jgi:hypothetical protein
MDAWIQINRKSVTGRKIMAARMARVGQRNVGGSVTGYVPILIRIQKAVACREERRNQLWERMKFGVVETKEREWEKWHFSCFCCERIFTIVAVLYGLWVVVLLYLSLVFL